MGQLLFYLLDTILQQLKDTGESPPPLLGLYMEGPLVGHHENVLVYYIQQDILWSEHQYIGNYTAIRH